MFCSEISFNRDSINVIQKTMGKQQQPNWATRHPRLALFTVLTIIGIVWCQLLPRLARQPSVQEHLAFLDENGIDPSAMFYTELDAMEPILRRLEDGQ